MPSEVKLLFSVSVNVVLASIFTNMCEFNQCYAKLDGFKEYMYFKLIIGNMNR